MQTRGAIATVVLLLFGPAVLAAVSRRAGLVSAVAAVGVLVYLVLRNERRRDAGDQRPRDQPPFLD